MQSENGNDSKTRINNNNNSISVFWKSQLAWKRTSGELYQQQQSLSAALGD